jgi:peptidoglycan/LPS O-acetylase OafA/YrhL
MLVSWYALNWGAYFWLGLAISDLDFTYKYRQWFVRPARHYATISALVGIFAVFMSTQYVMQVSYFNLPTFEHAIHPDVLTGLPIGQTERYGFPEFMYPQVHSLFAATALLLLCDLSSWFQAVLRVKFLRVLGFYSYSIYLLHGLVFWSYGAWVTVQLSARGMPYWANQLIVFTTSYLLLAVSVMLWTPFADVFAMKLGTALWRWAQGRAHYATIG